MNKTVQNNHLDLGVMCMMLHLKRYACLNSKEVMLLSPNSIIQFVLHFKYVATAALSITRFVMYFNKVQQRVSIIQFVIHFN